MVSHGNLTDLYLLDIENHMKILHHLTESQWSAHLLLKRDVVDSKPDSVSTQQQWVSRPSAGEIKSGLDVVFATLPYMSTVGRIQT